MRLYKDASNKILEYPKIELEGSKIWNSVGVDCEICEKSRREEQKKRELDSLIVSEVTKHLEVLRVQDGDILMIRVDGKKPGVPEMLNAFKKVFEQAKKKDVWIIAIPTDMVLDQVKVAEMNPAGWFRKNQLLDPKIWEKEEKKSTRKICLEEE